LAGPYCASKVAVHSLTKIIALENNNGVTCNALVPGVIDTPENRKNLPGANYKSWVTVDKIANKIAEVVCSNESGLLVNI